MIRLVESGIRISTGVYSTATFCITTAFYHPVTTGGTLLILVTGKP